MANFKATRPMTIDRDIPNTRMDNDPAYIKYLNEKAEENFMMSMLERNLEPC